MASKVTEKNRGNATSTEKKLDDLYDLIDGIEIAIITQDRDLVRGLYKPDWKAWFPKVDEVRDGGPDDPRLALILVEAYSAIYMKTSRPRPAILFEVVKGILTGKGARIGEEQVIGPREIEKAQ